MNRFMKLLKNGRIGKVCKLAAVAIAVIGIAEVALQLYSTWMAYRAMQAQPEQFGPYSSITYTYLMPNIDSALQSAATTIFYVVVLFVSGAVINAFFGPDGNKEAGDKADDTAITYESLDDDEVIVESIDRRR
ncbi:MAG: hypothetical protein JO011_12150 [Ktedonobacteraceae bacterium]|nr:hypothetical protein [Ktedonobacteraceae bacterium]